MYHVECDDYKRINRIINDHLYGFSLMRCSLRDLKLFSTDFQSALYAIDPKTKLSFEHKQLLADVFKLAIKLNEKVNFNWSLKRLEAEHKRQIRMCTELDFTEKSDEQIYKNVNLDTPTIKLLNTEKSIFYEGKSMFHCLYSCYYERIKRHQYIAFHMTFPESCTFSVKLNHNNDVIMDQIYAKYDKHVSTETEFIAQQFIDANYNILRRMLTKEQVYL